MYEFVTSNVLKFKIDERDVTLVNKFACLNFMVRG